MKVILDANIFISYLLATGQPRTVTRVVDACLVTSSIELVIPRELLKEITENVQGKEYLRTHISQEALDELLAIITSVTTLPPPLDDIPSLSPDPDDDYLLAYGLIEEVDYIVTGDTALLALGEFDSVKIIQLRSFLDLLEEK